MNKSNVWRFLLVGVAAAGSLFLLSCDDENSSIFDSEQLEPLPAPVGNIVPETDAPLNPTFVWRTAGDDGDSVVYDVYLGITTSPTIVAAGLSDTTYDPGPLQPGTTYYWAVRAQVNGEPTAQSAVWKFATRNGITYPVAVGNRWEYRCEVVLQDSLTRFFSIEVEEVDSSWSDQPAYIFHERYADLGQAIFDSSRTYYCQSDSGLYLLGQDSSASNIAPASEIPGTQYRFAGETYASAECLLRAVQQPSRLTRTHSATQVVYDPPMVGLRYPVEVDSVWTYQGSPYLIEKEAVAYEVVTAPAGEFGCFVIEWRYDEDNDGSFDDDRWCTDYVSGSGLVKRSLVILDIEVYINGQVMGTVDFSADYELVWYELE